MPRKPKVNIFDEKSRKKALEEIYHESHSLKITAINVMKNVINTINYDDKQELLNILPIVQKQMDLINNFDTTILEIFNKTST